MIARECLRLAAACLAFGFVALLAAYVELFAKAWR